MHAIVLHIHRIPGQVVLYDTAIIVWLVWTYIAVCVY